MSFLVSNWLTHREVRRKTAWLLVIPFLVFARPVTVFFWVGLFLTLLGLVLRGWSAGTINKAETLTTTGPYAYTQNPLYLGSFLIGTGLSLAGGNLIWLLLFLIYFVATHRVAIFREQAELTERFCQKYLEYQNQVPVFLPMLSPYGSHSPDDDSGFEWARYLRNREWEALLGATAAVAVLLMKLI